MPEPNEQIARIVQSIQDDYPMIGVHLLLEDDLERGYVVRFNENSEPKPALLHDLIPPLNAKSSGRRLAPKREFSHGGMLMSQSVT